MNQTAIRALPQTFFIILLISAASSAFGEVRLVPDEGIASISQIPEPLPLEALIRASLIASGVPANRIGDYSRQILEITRRAKTVTTGNHLADSEALLRWMHNEYLTHYVESQTRMDVLLESGRFNCVSSAVLYLILARSIGLEVRGVVTKDHAFCRLPKIGDGIDVETTNLYGFNPGSRTEVRDLIEGQTGFVYVPPGNYRRRREIGERALISLIYQNRIVLLQSRKSWKPTVGLALDRWTLAGTDFARDDFIASLKNVAAEANAKENNRDALSLLAKAVGILGDDHGLEQIAMTLFGNGFARRWNANQLDAALELVNDPNAAILVPASFLDEKRREVKVRALENTIKDLAFPEAAATLEAMLADGIITPGRWSELSLYLWSKEAQQRSSGGKWIEALKFLRTGPPNLGSIPGWGNLIESYEYNSAVTYHNRFVEAVRNRKRDEAHEIVMEGLLLLPNNTSLLADLESLRREE